MTVQRGAAPVQDGCKGTLDDLLNSYFVNNNYMDIMKSLSEDCKTKFIIGMPLVL